MSWASKRKLLYLSIVLATIGLFVFIISLPALTRAPTCFDLKQNGDEKGIDCSGSCQRLCSFEVKDISVLWKRAFKVTGDRYNLLAYFENQNASAGIKRLPYEFRFYDENNVFIGLRSGVAFIAPNSRSAIFEPGVNVGNKIPKRTSFQFLDPKPAWLKVDTAQTDKIKLEVTDKKLIDTKITPRLEATILNDSIFKVSDIEVIAIVYNENQNAVAASKNFIDSLAGGAQQNVSFTWPEPFPGDVFITEVITRYNPFNLDLELLRLSGTRAK